MRVDEYCRAVIASTKLALPAQAVLWMLASYVNKRTGETFVSLATIAEQCHVTRRHVRDLVAELHAAGIFAVVERPGRSSTYRFPIHPALSTPGNHSSYPANGGVGTTVPRGRNHSSQGVGTTVPPNHVPNQVHNRAPRTTDDDTGPDPTPGWFQDRLARHIEADTVDVIDREPPEPRMMWEVSM